MFLSDLSLVPIQTYTNDRVKLRKAIDDVASRATSVFDRDGDQEPEGDVVRLPATSMSASQSSQVPNRSAVRPVVGAGVQDAGERLPSQGRGWRTAGPR